LRTLARLQVLTRLTNEVFADVMAERAPHVRAGDIFFLANFLEGVATAMAKRQEQYRCCAVCGNAIEGKYCKARPDARYCSSKCRQRAYRDRVEQIDRAIRAPKRNKRRVLTDEPPLETFICNDGGHQ